MAAPSVQSILAALQKVRILETARRLDLQVPSTATKADLAQRIGATPGVTLRGVLPLLRRDELREACRAHGLPDDARARDALIDRLATAAGEPAPAPGPSSTATPACPTSTRWSSSASASTSSRRSSARPRSPPSAPRPPPPACASSAWTTTPAAAPRGPLELELGARVVEPARQGLGTIDAVDDAEAFRAYLLALRWALVTATRADLFQAPFRAGIHVMDHQLAPLAKALVLPRANLFIADDVGLGKTIEAGLVLQELLLRQRVDQVLIVAPPSVVPQWQDEMLTRFGLHFEIHDRAFVARRRAERASPSTPGAPTTASSSATRRCAAPSTSTASCPPRRPRAPLAPHPRRGPHHRPRPRQQVRRRLGPDARHPRARRPALREPPLPVGHPHNGHSNSFSALLGSSTPSASPAAPPSSAPASSKPVMVRRLKSDLAELAGTTFPTRIVQRWCLSHRDAAWHLDVEAGREAEPPTHQLTEVVATAEPVELRLAELLARYTTLMAPTQGRARLVFINLQKRLLSSIAAFHRTFEAHCKRLSEGGPRRRPRHPAHLRRRPRGRRRPRRRRRRGRGRRRLRGPARRHR
ncbi:MAG: SNF2-related protein [bacterium]